MTKVDYRLMVQVMKEWRLSIPSEIRAQAKIEVGEPFLPTWIPETQQLIYTRLEVVPFRIPVGGTLF